MLIASPAPSRSRIVSLPEVLNRHLSASAAGDISSVAAYIDQGAALVDRPALHALQRLWVPLHAKIEQLDVGTLLRARLELLATFCKEASLDGANGTVAHREAAFALLYFLKGFDRIPDTVPEVGLLDDAIIVQIVLQRHDAVLRAHWRRHRRAWPATCEQD